MAVQSHNICYLRDCGQGTMVQGIGEKSEGMVEVGIGIGRAIW